METKIDSKFDIKLNIEWIRHAESCSNYDGGNVDDKMPNNWFYETNIGYDEINQQIDQKIDQKKDQQIDQNIESAHIIDDTRNRTDITRTSSWRYHPNLSYIGMQQAIMLGVNYMRGNAPKYDIILSSASLRTVMTALLSLRQNSSNNIILVRFYFQSIASI
jgi:hypothetical protein